jgi:hypothetical protein
MHYCRISAFPGLHRTALLPGIGGVQGADFPYYTIVLSLYLAMFFSNQSWLNGGKYL